MAIIDPHTTEEQLQSGGDYRPMLGGIPRKNGLKVHMIGAASTKDRVEGVIVPSFDFSLDTCDQAFQQSVGAFWKSSPDPKHPKHFLPNGWAVPLVCYTFMGPDNEHFISPSNRAQMMGSENCTADEKADAFNDLWCSVKFDKSLTDKDKEYYLKKESARVDAKIPNRQTRFFSFANITTKDTRGAPHDAVVCYTGASHTHMVEQARWLNEAADKVIDSKWARYMLGDPTRPEAALVWTVDKRLLDPKDAQETNCLVWTQKREVLDDPLLTRGITQETLAKRFVLIDPAAWNIPTYQEQVDFMLANYHDEVTSEMIRHACGHRADVGERRVRAKSPTARPAESDDDYNPMTRNAEAPAKSFAPPAPTAPPAPSAPQPPTPQPPAPPAPPAAAAAVKFWVSVNGVVTLVGSKELGDLVTAHGNIPTMEETSTTGEWKTAGDFSGTFAAPLSAAPAPPPPGPPAPAPAEVVSAASLDDTRRNLFDDATYAAFSPEKRSEVDAVVAEMHAVTVSGKPTPAEIVDRVMQLMGA